ncbi:alpha/beta hydrolase [Nocardioides sp. B-3]|nr:alpha/beta hydrolase [Nocardioides sp. B-3]
MLDLPGRGSTFVTDTPGPEADSPAILLLHALGTTGLLSWYPAIGPLSKRFRVVTMDQRWHGRGIQSEEFSLADCADDAAAVIEVLGLRDPIIGGYSMGSIVAQRVWRQHPTLIEGPVLGATTDHFRPTPWEKGFHASMGATMLGLRGLSRSRTLTHVARRTARAVDLAPSDIHEWAPVELRRTSPWAVGQALAALGRHHTRPWLSRIDVPTAVVVTQRDRVIPPSRQYAPGPPDPRRHRARGPGRSRVVRAAGRALRAGLRRGGRHRGGTEGRAASMRSVSASSSAGKRCASRRRRPRTRGRRSRRPASRRCCSSR